MKHSIWIALIAVLIIGCQSNTLKVNEGVEVTFFNRSDDAQKVKVGDRIKLHMVHSIGDSVLKNTYNSSPINIIVSPPKFDGDLMGGLLALSKGDSAQILLDKHHYFKNSKIDIPKFLKGVKHLKYTVKIIDITEAKVLKKQSEKAIQEKIKEEIKVLQAHFNTNKIQAEITKSLLSYSKIKSNLYGQEIKKGDTILIHCKGALLDGTVFDNTFDQNTPYQVIVGESNLIFGLQEGLTLMKTGEKFDFYIPSYLGYGANRIQLDTLEIPPHSILQYTVETLDL